jgi:exonuclease SbcC
MRPVRLQLKGFSSFRDEQELLLEDLDLFAICGPTGSGKSSLLDAITYALYGKIPRLPGREARQFISQGQPRMTVHLEFKAGRQRCRITRSTPAGVGATRVTLERLDDGTWVSFGEGADRVREVDAMVERLVGLDYEAFTRSVLLPQGRFAEFLAGEARDRREILTDLLGLHLFKRMAARAADIARDANHEASARQDLLEREYEGVDQEVLRKASAAAKAARTLMKDADDAERLVRALARRWEEGGRHVESLRACADEVGEAADTLREHAEVLAALREEAGEAAARASSAAEETKARKKVLNVASSTRRKAEAKWGTLESLARLSRAADLWAEAAREQTEATEGLKEAEESRSRASVKVRLASQARDRAMKAWQEADVSLKEAEAKHEEVHRADLVGAVVAGRKVGDPCPVCERPLERIPKAAAKELERAKKHLGTVREVYRKADETHREAEQDLTRTRGEADAAAKEVARCKSDQTRRKKIVEQRRQALEGAFPKRMPDDPVAQLDRRIEEVRGLRDREEDAELAVRQAEAAERNDRERVQETTTRLIEQRAGLRSLGVTAMLGRVRGAAPDIQIENFLPKMLPEDAHGLQGAAGAGAKIANTLASQLRRLADEMAHDLDVYFRDARAALPGRLEVDGPDIPTLHERLRDECRRLRTDADAAERDAKEMRRRLKRKREMLQEVEHLRLEQAIYHTLAQELRADRLVAHLQEEALRVLARAGTERLEYLSDGRYRLAFENDEFCVVDVWNGEDRRSVRTLSGGETFLASLALALALSEQVQILAVTEKARLDSLFLDEGFGTLDAETLDTVVSAIEQLGGDGRMVGVITHVPDLAERMPVRIELRTSPRGSKLHRLDSGSVS